MFRTLAIAAMLLLAALAVVAAPAYAQDSGGGATPPPTNTPPPSPPTDPAPTPAPTPTPEPVSQPPATQPPPTSDPTPPPDQGGSQPATGPSDTGTKQPAHPSSGDEFTTSTAPQGSSTAAPTSSTSNPSKGLGTSRGSDTWLGQDTFVVSKPTAKQPGDGVTTVRRRFAGLFLLGSTTQATRSEAKARRQHETAKVSAVGSVPPKPGDPLPNQNPFLNLLSGPSGIAASLMLASMLAVLGAALVLPHDRLRAFRTPTVTWRPLAYVPPIELPG